MIDELDNGADEAKPRARRESAGLRHAQAGAEATAKTRREESAPVTLPSGDRGGIAAEIDMLYRRRLDAIFDEIEMLATRRAAA